MDTNGEYKRVQEEFVSAYFKASFRFCLKRLNIPINVSALSIFEYFSNTILQYGDCFNLFSRMTSALSYPEERLELRHFFEVQSGYKSQLCNFNSMSLHHKTLIEIVTSLI